MALSYKQRAVEVMRHMVTHDGNGGHGYTWDARWGDGTHEVVVLSDGFRATIANGDYDCSSAVISAWEAVLPGCTADATYTGNMRREFVATGLWEWHPWSDPYAMEPGDIALNEAYHTAMCISPDFTLAQFSINEKGGVYGGKQGDQTGYESNIKAFYSYPWDGVLAYIGPNPVGDICEVSPATGQLEVDGYWGKMTTLALQCHYGTEADGEVWHQWSANIAAQAALTSGWVCDKSQKGSPVVRALQGDLGVATDGIFGPDTVKALQKKLGFYQSGVLDGGCECMREMQKRLNDGVF